MAMNDPIHSPPPGLVSVSYYDNLELGAGAFYYEQDHKTNGAAVRDEIWVPELFSDYKYWSDGWRLSKTIEHTFMFYGYEGPLV
jgi:hypothetical protein